MATAHPPSTSPTMSSARARAPSKKTSLNSAVPVTCRIGRISMPSWSIGTRKKLMPLCLGASRFVRASTKHHCDHWASDVHTFWPWSTQSSPSRSARVEMLARSLPALGSE